MEKEKTNYFIDFILGFTFLAVLVTGIIKLKFVMNIFSLEWSSPLIQKLSIIHDISGVLFVLFGIIHLVLHKEWICSKTREFLKKQKNTNPKVESKKESLHKK